MLPIQGFNSSQQLQPVRCGLDYENQRAETINVCVSDCITHNTTLIQELFQLFIRELFLWWQKSLKIRSYCLTLFLYLVINDYKVILNKII